MGIEIPPQHITGICDRHRIRLAIRRLAALITTRVAAQVPVIEHPERGPVDEDVGAAAHVQEPGHAALGVGGGAVSESGVAEGGQGRPGGGGQGRRAHALPVRRFALLHGGEDVLGVVEVELVEGAVLEGDAVEPGCFGGFDQHAAADGDGVLAGLGQAVEVVIRSPAPHVFDVGGGGGRQVQHEEGGHAAGRVAAAGGGGFDEGVGGPADPEVRVPESDVARVGASDVNFDEDAAGEDVGDGEDHVGELGDADVAVVADFDHGERGVGVLEVAA